MEPGSEFRKVESLANIFNKHPDWEKMKSIIDSGVTYQISNLAEEER